MLCHLNPLLSALLHPVRALAFGKHAIQLNAYLLFVRPTGGGRATHNNDIDLYGARNHTRNRIMHSGSNVTGT